MKIVIVILVALVFTCLVMAFATYSNFTKLGDRIFMASVLVAVASMGVIMTVAVAYVLWRVM